MRITEVRVDLRFPFLGITGSWKPDIQEQEASWEMYVELVTRISVIEPREDEGLLREALTSLYRLFDITRGILRKYGTCVARPTNDADRLSFGYIAIAILNLGLRPVLAKWHPLLQDYEAKRPAEVSSVEHERKWDEANNLRKDLEKLRPFLAEYARILAEAAGVPNLVIDRPSTNTNASVQNA